MAPFEAQNENETRFSLGEIQIYYPVCACPEVGEFGTHERKTTRVETFQCKNPNCTHLDEYKILKQFVLATSYQFKELIFDKLKAFYEDVMKDGAKSKTIAKKYGISELQVSALRFEIECAIDKLNGLDSLVLTPQPDIAIAIDETFLKIEGTSIYVVIATGYTSRKTLGIKVSNSRSEEDIREIFDEAEQNTEHQINKITSDALNATQSMVKNLGGKSPTSSILIKSRSRKSSYGITATKTMKE
ncbi:MAG: DDE-type integrase/transposase/recombinase [Promethearchaeota archaeon]